MQRQVRLQLRPPPHSLVRTEIFSLSANSPRTGGIRARILSLRSVDWIYRALSAPLSNRAQQPRAVG
jgi:hypothetical protein